MPHAASTVNVDDVPLAEEPFTGPMKNPRIIENTGQQRKGAIPPHFQADSMRFWHENYLHNAFMHIDAHRLPTKPISIL